MAVETVIRETGGVPRFLFLSELLGRRVVDARGDRLGRICDLTVTAREPYPRVETLVVRRAGQRRLVAADAVESWDTPREIRMRSGAGIAPFPPQPSPDRLRLVEEILDRQIVDVDGAKVVRVN